MGFDEYRAQLERLLDLVDEQHFAAGDLDRLREAVKGNPIARYENNAALGLAQRLVALLADADRELPARVGELWAILGERLPAPF